MSERPVAVFFYGSYMNRSVLAEVALRPARLEVGFIEGFEIAIAPLANLWPCSQPAAGEQGRVYGLLTHATHAELARLYDHAEHVLGGVYRPEAVLVRTAREALPALCYVSHAMARAPAERAYVERVLAPAREHGFPGWYLERLASFAPASEA